MPMLLVNVFSTTGTFVGGESGSWGVAAGAGSCRGIPPA